MWDVLVGLNVPPSQFFGAKHEPVFLRETRNLWEGKEMVLTGIMKHIETLSILGEIKQYKSMAILRDFPLYTLKCQCISFCIDIQIPPGLVF